ncbi:MAG: alpha-amylase family glycosyl hydrolase [Symbiobacteriia bacterium]
MTRRSLRSLLTLFLSLSMVFGSLVLPLVQTVARADVGTSPSAPAHAVLVGDLQTAFGAGSDWSPSDNTTLMRDAAGIGTYIFTGFLKGGTYQYKVALDGNWSVSYPANNVSITVPQGGRTVTFRYNAATHEVADTINSPGLSFTIAGDFNGWTNNSPDYRLTDPLGIGAYELTLRLGAGHHEYKIVKDSDWNQAWPTSNVAFDLAADRDVTFYYYDASHKVKDTASSQDAVFAALASSVQKAIGASGDWSPADPMTRLWDTDGSGNYHFQAYLPQGDWEYKIALDRSWNVSYPADNVRVSVPTAGTLVVFSLDAATRTVKDSINNPVKPGHDNDIWWDDLRHDSRNSLYRSPFGAVPAGTPVTLRIQAAANDLTGAEVRLWDDGTRTASLIPMQVSGHSADGRYDYWSATVSGLSHPGLFYYHFVLQDGTRSTYYYAGSGQHGGLGAPSNAVIGSDYQITVYDPAYTTPKWLQNAVIYQIFPDRFNNGDKSNDPQPTEPDVYGNPIVLHNWSDLPSQPPMGSDFFGGDLQGVLDKLDYLESLGVQVIYFNPIFQAPSNHKYDTTDYMKVDPHFGDQALFTKLTQAAARRGIHVVLDGVFNHTGSDSAYFDKYSRYPSVGAFESQSSPYIGWYDFSQWPNRYNAWWGFDTLPKLIYMRDGQWNQSLNDFIYEGKDSVARHWLQAGAAGWRLDVPNEVANPVWPRFRQAVKATRPDAAIIGEIWDNASQYLLGNEFDSVMNYRFRDAVWNFFGNGSADAQGFDDALAAIREDYPAQAWESLMNLVDSHDTARISNVVGGNKDKLKLVALFQMTYPGAPTIYYGDEAGVTGGPDPDSRRTYPWGGEDQTLLAFYRGLTHLRQSSPALRDGSLQTLLVDSKNGIYGFGRKTDKQAAVVLLNNGATAAPVTVSVQGLIPDGTVVWDGLNRKQTYTVTSGQVTASLGAYQGLVLLTGPRADIVPPPAPTGLTATAGNAQVSLTWQAPDMRAPGSRSNTTGSATAPKPAPKPGVNPSLPGWANGVPGQVITGYNVYRTTVSGGDYGRVNTAPVTSPAFTDTTAKNATVYYYAVAALDQLGNESARSAEVRAVPAAPIGWAGGLWPLTITHTLSAVTPTPTIYAQVWADGLTAAPGQGEGILAQVGYGPAGSDPHGAGWTWVPMSYDMDMGNNDQYIVTLLPDKMGDYSFVARFSSNVGDSWTYTDGTGAMTVVSSGDITAPAAPTGLAAKGSLAQVTLSWSANSEADLYGYEIYRSTSPFAPGLPDAALRVARVDANTTSYNDGGLDPELTYYYTLVAVDESFNRSLPADAITARAQPSQVQVTLEVTIPDYTPAGDTIYVAGDFPGNNWNPGGLALTRIDTTHWSTTLTVDEGTVINYKYARGSWDQVEKDALGQEIANRQLLVTNQGAGTQLQSDTVARWRDLTTVMMAPADGFITTDASITVTGNAVPGYTVTVNGVAVTPDANGYFSFVVDLAMGDNTITIVGPDKDFGGTVSITRKVTRVQ